MLPPRKGKMKASRHEGRKSPFIQILLEIANRSRRYIGIEASNNEFNQLRLSLKVQCSEEEKWALRDVVYDRDDLIAFNGRYNVRKSEGGGASALDLAKKGV